MLHEVIFALHGFPGDICTKLDQQSQGSATEDRVKILSDHLPFVHPSEISLISQLLLLADNYIVIQNFIEKFRVSGTSLYVSALAHGLDDVLDAYRLLLRATEFDLLQDSSRGIAYVFSNMHSYQPILSTLVCLLEKVFRNLSSVKGTEKHNLASQHILDLIIQVSSSSCPSMTHIFQRLAVSQMRLFSQQLSAWLIYGIIHDPYSEFFVKASPTGASISIDDEKEAQQTTEQLLELRAHRSQVANYQLCPCNLPSIISSATANKILLAGAAVHMANQRSSLSVNSEMSISEKLEKKFAKRFYTFANSFCASIDCSRGDALIDLNTFNCLLEDILACISNEVSHYMLEDCRLIHHLNLVRDILLLGRGELFLAFFENLRCHADTKLCVFQSRFFKSTRQENFIVRDLLDRPPPSTYLEAQGLSHAVNAAFLAAARAVHIDDDELSKYFKFSVSINPISMGVPMEADVTAWDCLQLQFTPPPGLENIFTPVACDAYVCLFRFLLNVRRTEQVLHQHWAQETTVARLQKRSLDKHAVYETPNTIPNKLLHNQMAFFVNHLSCYLQVDVISAQFENLMYQFKSQQIFGCIEAHHETFLAGLQAQALLLHPIVTPCLLRLLCVCRKFVRSLWFSAVSNDDDASVVTFGDPIAVSELRIEFQHLASILFTSLSTAQMIASRGVGVGITGAVGFSCATTRGHLAQLLLRLDYNSFFTSSLKADVLDDHVITDKNK